MATTLSAQMTGTIRFEVDTNCGTLEGGIPLTSITGVNFMAATNGGTTAAASATLTDRTTYVSFPMADDGTGKYFLDFTPNGTTGNIEVRWFYQVTYDDPANPGTVLTTNEFLNNEADANSLADIPFFACDVLYGDMGATRKHFLLTQRDIHVRNAIGQCLPCGGSEWRMNMDYSNVPDAVTVNNAQMTMGENRFLSYNSSFVFVPLTNTGGDIYSARFAVRSNGDFFVGNMTYNFGPAEKAFLDEGTSVFTTVPGAPDRVCDVYGFGARSNFTPGGGQVKVTDYLWSSWDTEVPGTAVKPFTANSTATANQSYTAVDGFTYYMDNGSHLIAVDWGSETPAPASDVSVTFGANLATFYTDGTGFVQTGAGSTGAAIMGRTWDVANKTIGSNVTVRFFYSQAEFDALNALVVNDGGTALTHDDLGYYKVTSGEDEQDIAALSSDDVIILETGSVSTNTFVAGDLVSDCDQNAVNPPPANVVRRYGDFEVASFSGGGVGDLANLIAAPVELSTLSAEATKNDVMVVWGTATESGNDGFEVEHATNGVDFTSLGFVAGAGDSRATRSYAFEHVNAPAGVNFYRLKQMDLTGSFAHSNIVTATVGRADAIGLYPNPATNELRFTGVTQATTVGIRDAQGREVNLNSRLTDNGHLDVSRLAPGLYFATVQRDGAVSTVRFVKK